MRVGNPTIVVIEDDPGVRQIIRNGLSAHDFVVHEAASGKRGLMIAATRRPDLILLDLGLPDIDGIELLKRLREWTGMPIIALSARTHETDKVAAYANGIDDYIEKPFSLLELVARIRVALRRAARGATLDKEAEQHFSVANIDVNLAQRHVKLAGTRVQLSPLEYRMLETLIKYADKVVTYRQLLAEVWGPGYVERKAYVHIYMCALRRKLEVEPARPRILFTEPRIGFRLATEVNWPPEFTQETH